MAHRIRLRDQSTISSEECLIVHLFWGFLLSHFYLEYLFLPIGTLTERASRVWFFLFLAGFCLMGIIVRWGKCMNAGDGLIDSLVAVGCYSAITYYAIFGSYIWLIGALFIGYCILELWYLSDKWEGDRRLWALPEEVRRAVLFRKRAVRFFESLMRTLSFLFGCLLLLICMVRVVQGDGFVIHHQIQVPAVGFDLNYRDAPDSLTNHIDLISKIRRADTWEPLSVEEKREVLQAICDCERNYWGISYPIDVKLRELPEEIGGYYEDEEKLIAVNREFLEGSKAEEALNVILHEVYHAWEFRIVSRYLDAPESEKNLRIFMYCREYLEEMKNYVHGSEDYAAYYGQQMERHAREYAAKQGPSYYEQIDLIVEGRSMEKLQDGDTSGTVAE